MLVALIVAMVAAAVVVGVLVAGRRGGWLERARCERVLVHTTDGQSIEGLLREVARDGLVLGAARLLDPGVDMAGEVWVPREKVLMIQTVPS